MYAFRPGSARPIIRQATACGIPGPSGGFHSMTIERALRGIAGTVVLASLALAGATNGVDLTHPSWLWFTAFVGLNLLQSCFTNWCPMMAILQRTGMRRERVA